MSRPDISGRLIGHERQPLVVIDDFVADPHALRAAAKAATFGPGGHHYPGLRAPVPGGYLPGVQGVLASVLFAAFGHRAKVKLLDAGFSIVTTPPEALTIDQRLPHVDAVEPGRIALVHYLMPDGGDGTAFYRHRSTGFESLDEARAPIYFERLNAELREQGAPPPAYLNGDSALFEQVHRVEARFNRAVVYRSALLHSGAIGSGATLAADPATGRLTVTAFLAAE